LSHNLTLRDIEGPTSGRVICRRSAKDDAQRRCNGLRRPTGEGAKAAE
jgi:hypothetical protein